MLLQKEVSAGSALRSDFLGYDDLYGIMYLFILG